jgi:hypothetical protein
MLLFLALLFALCLFYFALALCSLLGDRPWAEMPEPTEDPKAVPVLLASTMFDVDHEVARIRVAVQRAQMAPCPTPHGEEPAHRPTRPGHLALPSCWLLVVGCLLALAAAASH